jgi:hypothetical protein
MKDRISEQSRLVACRSARTLRAGRLVPRQQTIGQRSPCILVCSLSCRDLPAIHTEGREWSSLFIGCTRMLVPFHNENKDPSFILLPHTNDLPDLVDRFCKNTRLIPQSYPRLGAPLSAQCALHYKIVTPSQPDCKAPIFNTHSESFLIRKKMRFNTLAAFALAYSKFLSSYLRFILISLS